MLFFIALLTLISSIIINDNVYANNNENINILKELDEKDKLLDKYFSTFGLIGC